MGQRIIGLTGGIATGKSTVAEYLAAQYHLPILDADLYARQAVAPGSPILGAIAARHGPAILLTDGTLNRARLGQIVFSDAAEKAWLEQQIHPFVRQCFATAMAQLSGATTVVQAIPLLFEADLTDQVTEIWVVTCTPETQLQRLIARNQLTPTAAARRIANQWPLAEKVDRANVVLDNETTRPRLYQQIDAALRATV
ncbi:dephospho-CoA kinase [Halomicronema sp. CCY15110]|uniref:dephospho-CoA kinase n=1 Tax=Halomicronema sp. CCY15110 TaxID=2767773 RepID=UPI0019507F54|nr:dephospho-CoA kinase [Halomicronema sp. CCY15110]